MRRALASLDATIKIFKAGYEPTADAPFLN